MIYRHQLDDGRVFPLKMVMHGNTVFISIRHAGGVVARAYELESRDFDPKALATRFLNEPLRCEEKGTPGCDGKGGCGGRGGCGDHDHDHDHEHGHGHHHGHAHKH